MPRLRHQLAEQAQEPKEQRSQYDIKTITQSMKRQHFGVKAIILRSPVASSLLHQNFTAIQPNQKWTSDITYLYTSKDWLYLAVIIDLHSRVVIG